MSLPRPLPADMVERFPEAQRPGHACAEALQAQTDAFEAYVAAQDRAKETLLFADACAAGKAWGRFVHLFVPVQGDTPTGRVPRDERPRDAGGTR